MNRIPKIVILACVIALSSCATRERVHKEISAMKTGPESQPHRSITNFSDGLRCMDNLMIDYGVRDISMLVEDLEDETSAIKAGTKDMLITAVSQMTRRSRAIKLIPFGNDSGNLIGFLANAGSQSVYNVVPQYDIRGSISQLDKSVVSRQAGGSFAADKFAFGGSASTTGSILGIDLSILSTADLSVLPGVTSSNAVILYKYGKGADADASIAKNGISFDFQVAKSEATIQALRNLIELASIELVGKLTKLPYWSCIGVPESTPEIQQEMEDWYYSMSTHDELNAFVTRLLVENNILHPTNFNKQVAFNSAIADFQARAKLPLSGQIDYELFAALLNYKLKKVPVPIATRGDTFNGIKANSAKSETELTLTSGIGKSTFKPGESVQLNASVNEAAYLYCFLDDGNKNVQRFFPNRFESNNYLSPGEQVKLPGKMPFDITANQSGKKESVTCFATQEDVLRKLPPRIAAHDFEPLNIQSLDDIKLAFEVAGHGKVARADYAIQMQNIGTVGN